MKKLFILLGTIETIAILSIAYLYFAPLYPSIPTYGNILDYGEVGVQISLSLWAVLAITGIFIVRKNTKETKALISHLSSTNANLSKRILETELKNTQLSKSLESENESSTRMALEILLKNNEIEQLKKRIEDAFTTTTATAIFLPDPVQAPPNLPKDFITSIKVKTPKKKKTSKRKKK